ncbi:MAG: 50S ribosomal protein L20 [Planctomycetota bacterium]|nr:50S ribosomal protein L20 [Planctomycetota bacterium]
MRVKGGAQARRSKNRVLKEASGFFLRRSKCWKMALIAVRRKHQQAYTGRKLRKRDFRSLGIVRLIAATRQHGMPYSRFVHAMSTAKVELDRKMLAEIAVRDPKGFEAIVATVKR